MSIRVEDGERLAAEKEACWRADHMEGQLQLENMDKATHHCGSFIVRL